jgi:hypothetical protein
MFYPFIKEKPHPLVKGGVSFKSMIYGRFRMAILNVDQRTTLTTS